MACDLLGIRKKWRGQLSFRWIGSKHGFTLWKDDQSGDVLKLASESNLCKALALTLFRSAAKLFMSWQVRYGYPIKTDLTDSCGFLPGPLSVKQDNEFAFSICTS